MFIRMTAVSGSHPNTITRTSKSLDDGGVLSYYWSHIRPYGLYKDQVCSRGDTVMWLRRPLDDILSSPAKVAVLRSVLRVSAPLSGREIASRAGVAHSPARAEAIGHALALASRTLCRMSTPPRSSCHSWSKTSDPLSYRLPGLHIRPSSIASVRHTAALVQTVAAALVQTVAARVVLPGCG